MEAKNYKIITPAALPVLTLTEIRATLKLPALVIEDDLLTRLEATAVRYFENITGRDLINKTYKAYLDCFPCVNSDKYFTGYYLTPRVVDNGILINRSKLQSITSIQYYLDNVLTLWPSANYYFTDEEDYSSIYLTKDSIFPITVDSRKQAIEIIFVSGYGVDATFVPQDIKQALMQYIAYLYENRGDCIDAQDGGIPTSAATLFANYRIYTF